MCCDCDEREVGVPYRCCFKHARDGEVDLNDVMELGMFDDRWLKIYNSHYDCEEDSEGEVADLLYAGQSECFQSEGLCTRVPEQFRDKVLGDPEVSNDDGDFNSVYPILGNNTTMKDLKEALWVRKRANSSSPRATTWIDLQLFRNGDDHDTIGMKDYANPDDIPFSILGGGIRSRAKNTEVSTQMKNKIREHNKKRGFIGTKYESQQT